MYKFKHLFKIYGSLRLAKPIFGASEIIKISRNTYAVAVD
ncbi:hypothetical protein NEISICOT_01794 [Neisseria sicca ATCC 29256]|uniref:Uncharacterized protein n=1 Tax=Neisseria sicca ATCC 29256 TaxID=547045 RepID=C6M5J5_NEISI|nr:hypothetical protein NEISICOT_01794 [Neisseria sicca ATCC 29256]